MVFFKSLLSFLLVLLISRVDIVGATVVNSSRKTIQTKILASNKSVMSGQIYKINDPSISTGDKLTLKIEGNGYLKEYEVDAYHNGYIKFAIPFIIQNPTSNNPNLKDLSVKITLIEKNMIFNNIFIKKPILIDVGPDVLKKLLNSIKSLTNKKLAEATTRGDAAAMAAIQKIKTIYSDVRSEYFSTGKISYSDGTVDSKIKNQQIELINTVIAGAVFGILNENNAERILPIITGAELNPFFNNIEDFSVESIHIAFTYLGDVETDSKSLNGFLGGVLFVLVVVIVIQLLFYTALLIRDLLLTDTKQHVDRLPNVKLSCVAKFSCENCNEALNGAITANPDYEEPDTNTPPVACLTVSPTPSSDSTGAYMMFDSSCSSDADGNLHKFQFMYDDGQSDYDCSSSQRYHRLNFGPHSATLIVTDAEGVSNSVTVSFNVANTGDKFSESNFKDIILKPFNDLINKAITADFSYAPTSGLEPLEVKFNGSSSTSSSYILLYTWQFSDGVTETSCHPFYQRPFWAGSYTAQLTVINKDGEFSTTTPKPITVAPNSGD